MSTSSFAHRRRIGPCGVLLSATTVLVCSTLVACGGDGGNAGPTGGALAPTTPLSEVLEAGDSDWSRLEAQQDLRFGGLPYRYDVFGSGGTRLPFYMLVSARPHPYVGTARIFENSFARAYFAFGIATEPGDVRVSGTMTCIFAEDEIGEGGLTVDLAAGTVSGWAQPFWADVVYKLVQTSFAPGPEAH